MQTILLVKNVYSDIYSSPYSEEVHGPSRHNLSYSSLPQSRAESPALVDPVKDRPSTPLLQDGSNRDPRYLLKVVKNLMRTRNGSVLTRNTILKMDHFEKGMYITFNQGHRIII